MQNPNSIVNRFGLNPVKGEVGIEIEMEGNRAFPIGVGGWRAEHEGSLRGYAMEYVLDSPCNLTQVQKHLKNLRVALEKSRVKLKYSHRAGVHVHVNVQDMTPEQVIRFGLLYYCFEDALVRYCGPNREGNHFCLRMKDAEGPLNVIENITRAKQIAHLNKQKYRYGALNFTSLFSYGSMEFRAMETQPDLSKIYEWCDILIRIKNFSLKLKSRSEIAERMSYLGPDGFFIEVLGEDYYNMLKYDKVEIDVLDSMRMMQVAIYGEELT